MTEAGPEQTALERAVARVGDRWTLLVVHALLDGPLRFGELAERLSGIAPNILSRRLKDLERDGVVVARAYSARPPRFAYELTAAGRELGGALRLLARWGATHAGDTGALRHQACGSPLEARWWCPACDEPVGDADDTTDEPPYFV